MLEELNVLVLSDLFAQSLVLFYSRCCPKITEHVDGKALFDEVKN